MKKFRSEAFEILSKLSTEKIKFMNLVDNIGWDKVIDIAKDQLTRDHIEKAVMNMTEEDYISQEEDNYEIITTIMDIANPFTKEAGFKQFYAKSIAYDKPVSDFRNVYDYDLSEGKFFVKEGLYKNVFSGLTIRIANGENNSLSFGDLLDRQRAADKEVLSLKDIDFFKKNKELSKHYSEKEIKQLELEFTLYHELAHATGIQMFAETKRENEIIDVVKETHSDICSLIHLMKIHKMDEVKALALVDDIINARNTNGWVMYQMFDSEGSKYLDHMTQTGLILLRDFVKTDLDYIKSMKAEDLSKFSFLVAERALEKENIEMLSETAILYPMNKEKMIKILENERSDVDGLFGRLLKYQYSKKPDENWVEIAADNLTKNPLIGLDVSYRIGTMDAMRNIKFPFSSLLKKGIKEDFEFYKSEDMKNELKLSKFFDAEELTEKVFKIKHRLDC